ncbi:MAG: glutathione-disulfide reductase [Sphingopyxis sp.]|nr:glutathione-disulfide reductase [Sphingopyxis sp.]
MSEFDFDLFVIGAGSGGVRASRIAASHGARVAVAEEYRVGGTCVIRGCVPKKLLVYGSHFAEDLADARRFGWNTTGATFDWPTLRDNVAAEVTRLEGLYGQTLANNNVIRFDQRATIAGPNRVALADGAIVTAANILIATGAVPLMPDVPGAEYGISSNEVFALDTLPKRAVIAGAGYIANEFAGIFHELGVEVTLATRGDRMLRSYDQEIVDRLVDISRAKGIDIRFNFPFAGIERRDDGSLIVLGGDAGDIETDLVLFAVGRVPNSAGLGLEEVGVAIGPDRAVIVDDHSRTTVPGIFAVGDVTNRVQLTPIAIREGHALADTLFGGKPRIVDYRAIPTAVFANPPLAGVGLTEAAARAVAANVQVYRSDFRAMKNVLAGRNERALYKMIVDGDTDRVLGLHIIGPESGEILQAAAIAVKAGLTKAAFDDTVALHPSMAEELVLMK